MKFNFSVPQISKKREDFNFDHSHVLTHNFGVTEVISAIDVKPHDDITIDLSAFTRLMPLPCPTYGGVKITHRAYFVPFDFVIRHFADFIALQKVPSFDTNGAGAYGPSSSMSNVTIPGFTAKDILFCLADIPNSEWGDDTEFFEQVPAGATSYDVYGFRDSNPWGMNYTAKGRRVVSWLAQLGYKLPNTVEGSYASTMKYDCLALLAFWKFYLDWVVPSRFVLSNPDFVYIKNVIDNIDCQNVSFIFTNKDIQSCNANEISLIPFLKVPTAFLDDDFYTTAFQSSYGVENNSSTLANGSINTIQGLQLAASTNPVIQTNDSNNLPHLNIQGQTIDQLGLLALGRLQRLVDTKKITSTSVLDWLRANYGIAPSHDALHLSQYLGSFDSQIMVGDVMATATTDTQLGTTVVGQYAGKGLGGSNAKWRVHSNSFGIVFVTAEISTKSSYVNGVSPLRRRFTPLSFYNEKFDNVGVRAIYHSELVYNTFESMGRFLEPSDYPSLTDIFGYQPRYAEYKHKDDVVSGDFMFPSVNLGLDSWYLARKFKITDTPKIGLEFLSATSDSVGSQYDRIFQNTDNIDHFYSVYQLKVRATSLMEKLFDYFKSVNDTDIDNDDLDVNIN